MSTCSEDQIQAVLRVRVWQVPLRNQHRALWGAESYTVRQSTLHPDTRPHYRLALDLSVPWVLSSLGPDSGPHYMLTEILTRAWLSSSLVPDSHSHFGWKFPSSRLLSANRMLRNLYSFAEWMAINRVFFRHLSFSKMRDSKMREHHVWQRPSFPESQQYVSLHFLSLVNILLHHNVHYYIHPTSYPWGNRLQECVWQSWVPYCFYLV